MSSTKEGKTWETACLSAHTHMCVCAYAKEIKKRSERWDTPTFAFVAVENGTLF